MRTSLEVGQGLKKLKESRAQINSSVHVFWAMFGHGFGSKTIVHWPLSLRKKLWGSPNLVFVFHKQQIDDAEIKLARETQPPLLVSVLDSIINLISST